MKSRTYENGASREREGSRETKNHQREREERERAENGRHRHKRFRKERKTIKRGSNHCLGSISPLCTHHDFLAATPKNKTQDATHNNTKLAHPRLDSKTHSNCQPWSQSLVGPVPRNIFLRARSQHGRHIKLEHCTQSRS